MYRSEFGVEADQYAALARAASSPEERELYLSMEKSWRRFADAQRRIRAVRARNPDVFGDEDEAETPPQPRPFSS